MTRTKIAHITTVDTSLRFLLFNQMKSLMASGFEVTGISSPGNDVAFLEAGGIRHLSVRISRNLTPFQDLKSIWHLYRILRREKFAIVHTHTPKAGLLGQLAARLAGVPMVVNTLHGFYFHDEMSPLSRRFYIMMEKIAASCSDLVLSQSSEDIETALKERIVSREKIQHLGNGIDLSAFDRARVEPEDAANLRRCLGIPEGVPVVGFVGRLAARRKGFIDFLHAAREVATRIPDVRFLIVGDPDRGKPDAVEPSVAQEFGIAGQCHFTGNRPNEELPKLYSLMNVLVLPSLFEGVPRVVMEASAMGVPSVVSNVKGNREAVEANRNGLLVPLGNRVALSEAILEILEDPRKASEMGREGRKIAASRFDEREVFKRVKYAYTCLLEKKARNKGRGD